MMLTRRIAVLTIATLSVVMLDACKKKPEPAPIPAAAPPRGPDADSAARAQTCSRAARAAPTAAAPSPADSIAAADAAPRDAAGRDAATLRATLTATVHFEFDQSDLRPDDKSLLDAKIPILQANTGVMIRVSGHTDERGSDEYNLALGQRRAAAAKAYLGSARHRGVAHRDDQLRRRATVSPRLRRGRLSRRIVARSSR